MRRIAISNTAPLKKETNVVFFQVVLKSLFPWRETEISLVLVGLELTHLFRVVGPTCLHPMGWPPLPGGLPSHLPSQVASGKRQKPGFLHGLGGWWPGSVLWVCAGLSAGLPTGVAHPSTP